MRDLIVTPNQINTINPSTPYDTVCHIESNEHRKQLRNKLNKLMGTTGKAFNYFVLASVDFFYHDGNKQINIINDLLVMAHQSRGYDAGRLCAYLMKVVPHKLVEKGNHKKPPRFGKRAHGVDYSTFDTIQAFIDKHPEWHKYGKPSDPTKFDQEKYLKAVVTKLKREKVDLKQFSMDLFAESQGAA